MEGRTVFVSNLLFATTEKELEDKFSQVSVLTDSLVILLSIQIHVVWASNWFVYIQTHTTHTHTHTHITHHTHTHTPHTHPHTIHPPTHTHTHTHTHTPHTTHTHHTPTHTHTHTPHTHITPTHTSHTHTPQCGEISEIRLIKTKGRIPGRSNIYAYVEFTTPAPVQQALGLDRSELNGRPMFVSPCRGKGEGGGQPKVCSTRLIRNPLCDCVAHVETTFCF